MGKDRKFKEFREIIKEEFGLERPHEIKALLKKIQEQGLLSLEQHRTKEGRLGYRIIPRKEFEDEHIADDDLNESEGGSAGNEVTDDESP